MDYKFLECKNCGASLTFDPQSVSMKCSFCGSLHLIEFDEPDDYKSLLEKAELIFFDIKQNQAKAVFSKWLKKGFFQPAGFRKIIRNIEFEGVYIPFFKFRAEASSSWTGRDKVHDDYEKRGAFVYGQIKHEMKNETRYKADDYEKRTGNHSEKYKDLISTTKGLSQFEVDMVMPFDDNYSKPFNYQFLTGYKFERPAIKTQNARDIAEERIKDKERYHCGSLVDDLVDVETKINFTDFNLMLLPVWIIAFTYNNEESKILINGQSGKIYGRKPISRLKVILLVLFILGITVVPGLLWLLKPFNL